MQSPKLIKGKVKNVPGTAISKLVTKFIQEHQDDGHTPFGAHNFMQYLNINARKKQSIKEQFGASSYRKITLADWRVLYRQQRSNNANKKYSASKNNHRDICSGRSLHINCQEIAKNQDQKQKSNDRKRIQSESRQKNKGFHTPYTPHKTSISSRDSYLESAIMQNLYEQKYIKQRKIQTANIKRHYLKTRQKRPLQLDQEQEMVRPFTSKDLSGQKKVGQVEQFNKTAGEIISRGRKPKEISGKKFLQQFRWPLPYEKVKIRSTSIRRYKDIPIEGIKENREITDIQGLRFYE